MIITPSLSVNGNLRIDDREDDDSPLLQVNFYNEATQLSDRAKLVLGGAIRAALTRALVDAGVLVKPLFLTTTGQPVYHGDKFWCFYEGQKESANQVTANAKFDYNDGEPRFSTKEDAQEAIRVYRWLNGERGQ